MNMPIRTAIVLVAIVIVGGLHAQTNNLTSGLGTNRINVAGSDQTNQLTLPLNSGNGSVFFRLVRPY
ncbi:MAG: hypothetical protein JF563_02410 [Acidobacteriales bacterium]|nr:hypothetical protein [Terriglobales bacterium]